MKTVLPARPYRVASRYARIAQVAALGFSVIGAGFVYWTVKDAPQARWPIAVMVCGAAIVGILLYLAFEQLWALRHVRRVAVASTEQHLEVVSWKPVRSRGREVGGKLRYKHVVRGRERILAESLRVGEAPYFTNDGRTHVAALVSEADPAHPWIVRADLKPFVVPAKAR